jgi:predicted alpha/beta-fold hydrolase
MKQKRFLLPSSKRWFLSTSLVVLVAIWAVIPAIRAFTLVANPFGRSAPHHVPSDLPVQEVHFTASDGVRLAGWLVIASPKAPTIILVHGFKGSRVDMLPWAQFLYHAGGYNVLLYDSRGCGESEGWGIALGAREPDDVIGAVQYLQHRSDLTNKQFGALGISLGAGIVLLAAARESALQATVANSAWVDESAQINRMGHLSALPLLPYELTLVDNLIGAHLEDTRPGDVISRISPRAIMLIHSADDTNTTTPLTGEHQLYQAAQSPKMQWIAPSGGHTGALKAHTAEYEQRVLAFFSTYINKH